MDLNELTAQEWFTLVEGTGGAMGAVVSAQPSGRSGFEQEMRGAYDAMAEMAAQEWETPFMQAFKNEIISGTREQDPEYQRIGEAQEATKARTTNSEDAVQRALQSMRDAVALVESKGGPEAAVEYKQYLYHLSEKTAGAAKEGSFLGIGGAMVSHKEQAVLDQIKLMFGL